MTESYSDIDSIILAFLNEKISWEEKEVLENWLKADRSNEKYFREIFKIWKATDTLNENKEEVDKVLQKIKHQLGSDNVQTPFGKVETGIRFRNVLKWAAIIMLSVGAGAVLNNMLAKKTTVKDGYTNTEVLVPLGSKSTVHLPDGSVVILNAGSKLSYNVDYGVSQRNVSLVGEGYFKVAKQKDKPFIVHTSKASVKALGTEFNVKAYPEEDNVETILVKGSIVVNEIETKGNKEKAVSDNILLKPGQKIKIFKTNKNETQVVAFKPRKDDLKAKGVDSIAETENISIELAYPQIETSWKENRWIIQGKDLQKLSVLFSRRFNVHIRMLDPELEQYRFSGTIQNETIEQVFSIMQLTIPIYYTINKGEVTWSLNRRLEKDYKEAY
jgi:transmembrane sensor